MRRALFVVVAFVACRDARAPEPAPVTKHPGRARMARPPQLAFTLSVAESAQEPLAWTAVADAYARELEVCPSECQSLAREVVEARLHALQSIRRQPHGEQPVPPELDAAVAAIDDYVARLDSTDADVAPMKHTAASALWRYRQDDALPRLEEILRDHRDDETAEYAANRLLHLLLHRNRLDELRFWMTELSSDETFLADKPDLQATLAQLRELVAAL